VVEAVWHRAIQQKEVEIMIPRSRGLLAKFANTFPTLINLLTTSLQKRGRERRLKLKKDKPIQS
jgi:hypothetical protein